jgi:hypothetical protein
VREWLRCYTDEEIAELIGGEFTRRVVTNEIADFWKEITGGKKLPKLTFSDENWQAPLYNVWTFAKKTNETEHFGNSEWRHAADRQRLRILQSV